MFAFINEVSIAPVGVKINDSRPLIKDLIKVYNGLKQYKIEKVRSQKDFHKAVIAGSVSIEQYHNSSSDADERGIILSFLGNVVDSIPLINEEVIKNADSKSLFDIYLDGQSSSLVKEAYLMDLPLLSFKTKPLFQSDILICQHYTLTELGEEFNDVKLINLFHSGSNEIHSEYLLEKCNEVTFAITKWDPFTNPCWRTEVTKHILKQYGYPDYKRTLSPQECRARNTEVAIAVLEANGWYYNKTVTGYNHHRDEVWRIYSNDLCSETVYISVDLGEGEFEIQNRRGKWERTVFFDGSDTNKDYKKENTHNINIK